nr:putative integron gene cassette protein [uncultured bacterium]
MISNVRQDEKGIRMSQNIIAIAVACGLILIGALALKRIGLSLTIRVLIGAALLVSGIALIYPLIGAAGALDAHPIRLGIAAALAGLGINQLAAPIRMHLGRPA